MKAIVQDKYGSPDGRPTYRHRLHGVRKGRADKRLHREHYRELRARHPQLFSQLRAHRQHSDLGRVRKSLYPLIYGGRRRFAFERALKTGLDRLGIWTLRR